MKITNYRIFIFLLLNTILTSCCPQTRIRSYIIAEKEHSLIELPVKAENQETNKESVLNVNKIK